MGACSDVNCAERLYRGRDYKRLQMLESRTNKNLIAGGIQKVEQYLWG